MTYVVDLIVDGGADPTGATDCSAAFNTCFTLLTSLATDTKRPKQSCQFVIPPGRFRLNSTPNICTFSYSTDLEVVGYGDASIVEVNVGTGNIALAFQNCVTLDFHHVTFVGVQNSTTTYDCAQALYSSPTVMARIHDCRFQWILCDTCAILCSGAGEVDHCEFGQVASTSSTHGVVWSNACARFRLHDNVFTDVSGLNGYSFVAAKGSVCQNWFRHDNSGAVGGSSQVSELCLENNYLDEGVIHNVVIQGGPTANVPMLVMKNNYCNTPSNSGGTTDSVVISDVDCVDIAGHICSGYTTTDTGAAISLLSVGAARIRKLVVNNSSSSNYIKADSNCKEVEVEESPDLLTKNIQSSATITTRSELGVKSDVRSSGAAVSANLLVKPGSSGFVKLATTDKAGSCAGIANEAASAASVTFAVARPGQQVTVLNDGAAAIAIGDKIVPSSTTAGEVTHSTTAGTAMVGVALTAAAATAGTAFQMQYVPGVV